MNTKPASDTDTAVTESNKKRNPLLLVVRITTIMVAGALLAVATFYLLKKIGY